MLAVGPEVVLVVGDGAPGGRPVRRRETGVTCADSASTSTFPSPGPSVRRDGACPWHTRSVPGCSTRPASPGRASAWARPICTSCCATCPAPWASSRSGTVPHADRSRRPATSTKRPVLSTRGSRRSSPPATPAPWPRWTRPRGSGCWLPACPPGGRWGRPLPAATSSPGCTTTTRPSASATWSPTGSHHDDASSGRGGGRTDRHREDGPRRGAGAATRRRGGQRRLDAALPRHGHRHRQARPRRARRRSPSPARPVARPRAGVRRGLPGAGAGRDRPAARERRRPAARRRLGPLRPRRPRRARLPRHGRRRPGPARGRARRRRRRRSARAAGRARPRCRRRRSCPATDAASCARWR